MPAKKTKSKVKPKPKKKTVAKKAPAKKVKKTTPKAKKAKPRTRTSSVRGKEKLVGKVDHYFDKIQVAAMKLEDSLKVGDTIRIEGGSVAFTQQVASMQIEHESVNAAKKGDEVGFKVKQKVREGYRVFKA